MIPKIYHFKRPERPKRMILKDYDLRVLDLVDEFRFLDSALIYALLKLDYPEMKYDRLKHRLQKLWANGFLDRPAEQVVLAIREEQSHLIYTLTAEGADLLAYRWGKDPERLKWRTDRNGASFRFIAHQLAISRFRAAIYLAGEFSIPFWLGDGGFTKRVTFRLQTERQAALFKRHPGEPVRVTVVPDSFFGLEREGKTHFYALEIDRGTRTVRDMARKFLGYYKLLQGIRRSPLRVEGHEVNSFRILTVTPRGAQRYEGARLNNLRAAARAVDERGKGLRNFWFAKESEIRWEEPESALRPIWQTPIEGEGEREGYLSLLD